METEVTRHGSHTESRMRENCTYGSMRGRAHPTGRSALLYTLLAYERRTVSCDNVRADAERRAKTAQREKQHAATQITGGNK